MNTEEVEALLRAARPATTRRGDPLSARARAELDDLLATRPMKRRSSVRRWALVAAMMAIIVGAITTSSVIAPQRATALTPKPLVVEHTSMTKSEIIARAVRQLNEQSPSNSTAGTIVIHQWALDITVGADNKITTENIAPEVITIADHPDGSSHVRHVAGVPFPGQEVKGLPKPGTVLGTLDLTRAETGIDDLPPMPTTASGFQEWFNEAAMTTHRATGSYMDDIGDLLAGQIVTTRQQAALVDLLGTLPHLKLDGEVTDRLGRRGFAFTASDAVPGKQRNTLVISASTGQIMAAETVWLANDRPNIKPPAVIEYAAWTQHPTQ